MDVKKRLEDNFYHVKDLEKGEDGYWQIVISKPSKFSCKDICCTWAFVDIIEGEGKYNVLCYDSQKDEDIFIIFTESKPTNDFIVFYTPEKQKKRNEDYVHF